MPPYNKVPNVNKPILGIDIETFSSAPLPKCGVYRYVDSPDFEILLFSYAFDDEPIITIDLACGEKLPEKVLQALEDETIIKAAWSAQFERVCLSKYLGHWLDPHQWRCTAVMSSYSTMPPRLADAAYALNVTEKKMEEGKDLIRYFSVPCKPTKTNGGRTRNLPEHAPDKWAIYKAYNAQDVATERALRIELEKNPLPEHEWELYALDQLINDRGVRIDKLLVKQAIAVDEAFSEQAFQRAKELTGLENPGSVTQLKVWLADQDIPMESLAKKIVQEKAATTEGIAGELLNLRLELSKTSVKKYEAMARTVCRDGRVHGMLQFGGASRTMRWAGRLVQAQNLPQNHLPDLSLARDTVKTGDVALLETLFGSVPNTLSELIRTAFIPKDGHRFIVADFSAIEARVLAWLAGEEWVLDEFRGKGKIYEATAARMFHIPQETIVKGHPNYEYRQKGKQATLSCIAEGQLVLTKRGLIPIERVKTSDLLWDGNSWVSHEGVICQGENEVITYDGLTATKDHYVWVEGQQKPIRFGYAATSGARLLRTEYCGQAIRVGSNSQRRKALEQKMESMLCADKMCFMRQHSMDNTRESTTRDFKRMPKLFSKEKEHSSMAGKTTCGCEITMRKSNESTVYKLRSKRYQVFIPIRYTSRRMDSKKCSECQSKERNGSDRQQWRLCSGQYSFCDKEREPWESPNNCSIRMGSTILALLSKCYNSNAFTRINPRADYPKSPKGSKGEAKGLENNSSTARLYDIRNAGPNHRFTVSGALVHNCGYGGGVGALKAMGAKMPEEEMQPLVDAWRAANPNIVAFWYALGDAASEVIKNHNSIRVGKVTVFWQNDRMYIQLPAGRRLCYISPRFVPNRFGGQGIGFLAPDASGKMVLQETFGGKLAENLCQSVARDLLAHGMMQLEKAGYPIVFHVHDEAVMEVPDGFGSVEEACRIMAIQPEWAKDLPLRADGDEMMFYMKT